jgi:uncharacterized protein (TIGR02118 family)
MIKFTVLYPNHENASFDFEYYVSQHLPLTQNMIGNAVKKIEIEKGISGANGAPVPYIAIGHLYFESIDSFRGSFLPHLETFRNDISKFTNIQPLVQISEILEENV